MALLARPWTTEMLGDRQYDCAIAAVGYETRARFVGTQRDLRASSKLAIAFPGKKVLAYRENERLLGDAGFRIEEKSAEQFGVCLKSEVQHVQGHVKGRPFSICVDISSLTRLRLALIVEAIWNASRTSDICVDFLYSLAQFSAPSSDLEPVVKAGPVVPAFAGWSDAPELAAAVILGLGYETHRAIGAVEYLEPAELWIFRARSRDEDYNETTLAANRILLESVPRHRLFEYTVEAPFHCFGLIESLVYGMSGRRRPIMLPFGPKVFALCCLLVGVIHPAAAVWRVSAEQYRKAVDRVPNGTIVGLTVEFARTT